MGRPAVAAGTNLVVVRGELRAEPRPRAVAGAEIVSFDLVVRTGAGPAESVPVVIEGPARGIDRVRAGTEVVVIGRVRRRFFRVGGATATRTEVQADAVVPVRARVALRRALDAALVGLDDPVPS